MTADSPTIVAVRPFTKAWWCLFWADVAAGRPVDHLARLGRLGRPRALPVTDLPTPAEVEALVAIDVDSAAYRAWRRWAAQRGARLPRPSRVPAIWAPRARP